MKHSVTKIFLGVVAAVALVLGGIKLNDLYIKEQNRQNCRNLMAGFAAAVHSYQSEYMRLPVKSFDFMAPEGVHPTRGTILKTLNPGFVPDNVPDYDNERKTNFYEPPMVKEPQKANGVYFDEHHEPVLADPWGEPFYFILDVKGQGKIPNPDPRDNKEHPFIKNPDLIIFSAGPDHNPDTWDDNVLLWK